MRVQRIAALIAVALLAPTLLITGILADLRSPEGTAALGSELANDPAVRELLVTTVVAALVDDAVERSPTVRALVPLVRPLLEASARATISSPAGREAVASALTDAIRQLTRRGPVVIDLRAATLAFASEAPAPLDTLSRAAVELGAVGLIVLGDPDGTLDPDTIQAPDADELGRIAGLQPGVALGLVAAALLAALLVVVRLRGADRTRGILVAGSILTVVGGASLLILRTAPSAVTGRFGDDIERFAGDGQLVDILPTVVDGFSGLLGQSVMLAGALTAAGVLLLVAGAWSARRS
jgi:hypothetical protein